VLKTPKIGVSRLEANTRAMFKNREEKKLEVRNSSWIHPPRNHNEPESFPIHLGKRSVVKRKKERSRYFWCR